jgi:hypothetical protein
MFKAPTTHGLDRKFKTWRKGKSQKANKKGSLKQQLRGHARLLTKVPEDQTDRRNGLQQKIQELTAEIDQKQQNLQEKKNAERAHAPRFLDRQKLTRKEKQERNGENRNPELYKLALDEVYVAHHPNDIKYMALFQKSQRIVDQSRHLYRRAVTRKRILKLLASSSAPTPCNWITKDQYDRLPNDWTIQDEENTFGGSVSRKDVKQKKVLQPDDSRFALAAQHEGLLQAADELETELDKEEGDAADPNNKVLESPDSNSSSSDDSDDDHVKIETKATNANKVQEDASDSSSDSDSSDDSDMIDEDDKPKQTSDVKGDKASSSDSSDSSSSSDSDSDDEDEDKEDAKPTSQPKSTPKPEEKNEEEVDDFLLDDDKDQNDSANVFQNASAQLPGLSVRGDKSRGWETQQERPGGYKKRRVRR